MKTRKLTRLALLAAIALTIFVLEAQVPALVPVPGVKLGLANIVTVVTLYLYGPGSALTVLLVRVVLGSLATGQVMAMLYSLSGGLLSLLAMLPMRRVVTEKQLWALSIVAAMAHNCGQILAAMALTGTPAIVVYLPVLLLSGMVTGLFTGLCAQFALKKLRC
ncbi:MAG: Gx transporter family protein [Oscillospiraceae bacterium]|nr:Gx transporter family protein [Oscillospiraceae bacterium]